MMKTKIIMLILIAFKFEIGRAQKIIVDSLIVQVISDKADYQEKGFVALNDSVILTNYYDSALVINLNNGALIKKLHLNIDENFTFSEDCYNESNHLFDDKGRIYLRIKYSNGEKYFSTIDQNLNITKICRIETYRFRPKWYRGKILALTGSGDFYNNSSGVPTSIQGGIILMSTNGYLLRNIPIAAIDFDVDTSRIFVGARLSSTMIEILSLDSNFVTMNRYKYTGDMNRLFIQGDNIYISGSINSFNILKLDGIGDIKNSVNNNFHYVLKLDRALSKVKYYCTVTGSSGYGYFWNGPAYPPNFFLDKSKIMYLPFSGMLITRDKYFVTTSGANVILGSYESDSCEPIARISIISPFYIWCNFSATKNLRIGSFVGQQNFFFNERRYVQNLRAVNYFRVNENGLVNSRNFKQTMDLNVLEKVKYSIFYSAEEDKIKVSMSRNEGNETIEVYSSSGTLIKECIINDEILKSGLDFSDIDVGVYFIRFNGYVFKMIKT